MKASLLYSIIAASLLGSTKTNAQIVPQLDLTSIHLGGTGASEKALERLNLPDSEWTVMNKLSGPSKGWGRSRHDVQVYKVTENDLPGVENYFVRSSTVILDPKGSSPLHSHFERPAFLQIISGSVFQHRSDATSFYMGPEDFTYTSHGLVHWWLNESETEPMRIWIVELCTNSHHCDAVVDGGAAALKGSKKNDAKAFDSTTIHEIDLANEFQDAKQLKNQMLRLRKIVIKPGESVSDGMEAEGQVAFLRLAKGALSVDGEEFKSGDFLHAPKSLSNHVFTNIHQEDAVLYAVDITNPR